MFLSTLFYTVYLLTLTVVFIKKKYIFLLSFTSPKKPCFFKTEVTFSQKVHTAPLKIGIAHAKYGIHNKERHYSLAYSIKLTKWYLHLISECD